MTRFKYKKEKGFIALISAIIISTVLLAFLFTTNTKTFYARFDSLDTEYKRTAMGLSESCVDQALLKLAQNYYYDPVSDSSYVPNKGVPVTVGDGICYIVSTTPAGTARAGNSSDITIYTQGVYKGTFSDFQTEVKVLNPVSAAFTPASPNIAVISWQEVP